MPNLASARKLARIILRARAAACVSLVPKLESHYWWREKLAASAEVLLLCKTTHARLAALEKLVLANHPYDTPEILALNLARGNARYLRWLAESASQVQRRKRG